MYAFLIAICLTQQGDIPVDLAKIESVYHQNDAAKMGYLFRYSVYKSSSSIDPEIWLADYKKSNSVSCRYYEDDQQVIFEAVVQSQKNTVDKPSKSGNAAKMTFSLDHSSTIFNKAELLQYQRAATMSHIQMSKRDVARVSGATPMNYGQLGECNEFAIDAMLRLVRSGGTTVKAKRLDAYLVNMVFRDTKSGLIVDVDLNEAQNYAPVHITMHDSTKDPNDVLVRSKCMNYERRVGGFYYPSLIQKQMINKGKVVGCTAIELTSITKPTPNELKDHIDKDHSINVDGMLYSNMNNTLKQIGYEDVPRLYQQCEELSLRTLAAKAPKTTSSRMPYVFTAAGLVVVLLVYLYIRRTRKMSLPTTT